MSNTAGYGDSALQTISADGAVPHSRMQKADDANLFWTRLRDNDQRRSWKRAKVNGLVDGNPPYKASKLRDAGRAEAANFNPGTGRMYMESGSGAFYDLFSEAPGLVGIRTSHGKDDEERDTFSRIMSAKADLVLGQDPVWDFEMQISQWEMTLHGCGPLFFEDNMKVLPRACHCGELKVPERTRADTNYWEAATIEMDYYPPELYEFIENEAAATAVGWDTEYTRRVIANAMDVRQPDNRSYSWEFYQQELKNNSLSYYDDSKVCHLVHLYFKEFSGKITHCILEREMGTTTQDKEQSTQGQGAMKFLYRREERFDHYREAVHPMYFDRGNGGFHHSVTGLGVKMYSAMEHENRLICNLWDKVFAPKIFFKPTSNEAHEKFQVATFGDYGIVPAGTEISQNPIQGFVSDGLAMYRTSQELMQSNLSSYRQQVPVQTSGNPPTKFQKEMEASQQSALSKTTFNRYYKQLDLLYVEIVRRLCNLNSTDKRAQRFQELCVEAGLPRECFGRVDEVKAVRVIGQGSAFMRKVAVDSLLPMAGSLPEEGRANLLNDKIACEAGQGAVERYNPRRRQKKMADDQDFMLAEAITMIKNGLAAPVTSSQNPVRFAAGLLQAATQSLQSLQQGANPQEVLAFLHLAGPLILAHLKRFANDPTRAPVFQAILKQWKQLAQATDKLQQQLQKMAQQKKQQQQKTQQAMGDMQIKAMKARGDLQLKAQKQKAQLQLQAQKHGQQLALADAQVASTIHRQNRLSAFQEAQAGAEEPTE